MTNSYNKILLYLIVKIKLIILTAIVQIKLKAIKIMSIIIIITII